MEQELTSRNKEQEMFALIAEHESSSITVKEFCELYDLSTSNYYYWQKKYWAIQGKDAGGESTGFTLLRREAEPAPAVSRSLFAEFKGIMFYQQPSAALLKELIG